MNRLRKAAVQSRERAAALIIVLAFVVLLTGLGVAYLSRTTSDRQVAHSSFNQSNVDQLAQSAMDNIIGDLRQELVDGSTASTVNGITIYTPTSAANMVPQRSGNPTTVPNLIRRSVRADAIPAPGRSSRASAVNSTNDPSANGRFVTATRWNSHYLVPKADLTTDDSAPNSDFASATPDWVFVTTGGANPAPAPVDVIGRYAYAIYDEAGLLDMNLAGYPTGTTVPQSSGKVSLAFADLTSLPAVSPTPNANFIVGWRNYATTQPQHNFPDILPGGQLFASNLSNSTAATNFYNFVVNNPMGPLTVRSDIPFFNNRTDQMFLGRQQLIAFQKIPTSNSGVPIPGTRQFGANALQCLGTFSREAAAGSPQWTGPSPTPTSVNPNFQTLLVTGSFTRNDGTTASVGDPLVNKPFLLQRLNWLTYKGPSGPRHNSNDDDIRILKNTYGVTDAFLQQGTDANILKYFGLVWDTTNERWNYTGPSGGSLASSIATFGVGGTQGGTREPNFFELLQAGILNNSIGDVFSSDPSLPSAHQQSKMLHILTIGANLIAQSRADSYPVRIACNVGGTTMEAVGMPRLPCLSSLTACPVAGTDVAGGVNWFLIPNLWDPFRNTWDLTEHVSGTPNYPRPTVRITVSGGIGFGSATVTQSGSVAPTSVTIFPAISTGNNASLPLATGNSTYGRDGLLNAMRLGTSDINGTVTRFNPPTQSPGLSVVAQWNRIVQPTNDPSAYRNDEFVVFRLSLPGILIVPLSILGQKPVLILQSGFQVSLDYQSPNGQWYSYSLLQGNNASNTWITANPAPGLCLGTSFSQYGINPALPPPPPTVLPTIINSGPPLIGQATLWTLATLAQAPMFAKADPRSIRYNTTIGVVNLANPPLPSSSAGIMGSIWPSQYATPPPMSPSAYPTPTPTPNPNPATLGDNALAGSAANPYNEFIPAGQTVSVGDNWRPVMMNRPFRSVGEMAYAFRDQPFKTLSFSSANSPDAALLDLFSVNDYPRPAPTVSPSPTSTPRAGVINVNSRQAGAIAAVIAATTRVENAVTPILVAATDAINTGTIFASLSAPVTNKAGLANLIANASPSPSPSLLNPSVPKTEREAIARALGEADQARTWNLLIDVIAQGGKYAPGTTSISQANKFAVDGEQRYWIHVAIDRFTGQVIDKQIEVVNE